MSSTRRCRDIAIAVALLSIVLVNEANLADFRRLLFLSDSKASNTISIKTKTNNDRTNKNLLKPYHYIYDTSHEGFWGSSPIVVETHKLVFFTIPKVGCSVWKQLFRRMMGFENWNVQDYEAGLPHNPAYNGLKYLYNYSIKEASIMMTSPEWTRAIMVRDPKMRFLSAFLDKSVGNNHKYLVEKCCPDGSCVRGAQSILGFLDIIKTCVDVHWRAQVDRIDAQFWPYIDSILHLENAAADAELLLKKIGAWDKYGASGWGEEGKYSIFGSKEKSVAGLHATHADQQIFQWFTPKSEQEVESFYRDDYGHPPFQLSLGRCISCET
jgi:hypothetical protein